MISEGNWDRLFLSHTQPLSFIWSFLYQIFPKNIFSAFILTGQTFLLTLPAVILYRTYGFIPAIAFALYFPLWYNALFDFHIDHLAIPFLLGFFIMEKRGAIGIAVVFGLLLALVKEIFAIQAVFCGLYLFFLRKHRLGGLILTLTSSAYFFISYVYLRTYFNPDVIGNGDAILGAYSWLGNTPKDIFLAIQTKPLWLLGEFFSDKERLKYLFYLFGALGFIPLLRPGILVVAIPILAHSLLSSDPKHYGFTHHYTAGVLIPNIIAFAEGLPKAIKLWEYVQFKKERFQPTLLIGLLACHIVLSPSPASLKFYNSKAWRHHYAIYLPSDRNKMIKDALKTHIPPDPEKIISIQNSINFSYLMERKVFKVFPHGAVVNSPTYEQKFTWNGFFKFVQTGKPYILNWKNSFANYVVLDLKRPWFIVDQGCYWVSGKCKNNTHFENRFLSLVERTREKFGVVFERDGFLILKRKNKSAFHITSKTQKSKRLDQ